jgi:hypothetical protein
LSLWVFYLVKELLQKYSGLKFYWQISLLATFSYFLYLMLLITFQYIPYNTDVAFLRIKQDYVPFFHYRLFFFIHVYSSIFVLPAAFTQFSPSLLRKRPALHKLLGKIYAYTVLLLAAPSGFVIGLYANGGIFSRIAFCTLAILWFYFTLMAVFKIKKKKILDHKAFMYRSFALAVSALTLRGWKFLLVYLFHPHPMDVYRIVAWLGWIPNLIIAEMLIKKYFKK